MGKNRILFAKNISKKFPGIIALNHVDFELYQGEVHALVGENGAGKSTFIKILSGVYSPDEGELLINEKPIRNFSPISLKNYGVATVFQELSLVSHLTIEQNIFLGQEETSFGIIDKKKIRADTNKFLSMLRKHKIDLNPDVKLGTLRAGEKRLVEFLKAISKKPKILILDEPTEALSDLQTEVLFKIMETLKNEGIGIVYISHKLSEVFELADRVTVLRDGLVSGTLKVNQVEMDQLINMMVGRNIKELFPERRKAKNEAKKIILKVTNVTVDDILFDISFHLKKGEILGISGLVGSGRTELAHAIFGILPINKGSIEFDNKKLTKINPEIANNLGIGLIPEDRYQEGLIPVLTVKENIILPAAEKRKYSKNYFLKEKNIRQKVKELIKILNIKLFGMDDRVVQLSGGNQQKVVVAKSLCSESKLFIFDEPTQGIDVKSKMEIYQIVKNLANENAGIIIISSDLKEILGLTDKILVMRKGKIVGAYDSIDATEEKILSDALH
jgi:ABC-type sugar transport system ATPase subunit